MSGYDSDFPGMKIVKRQSKKSKKTPSQSPPEGRITSALKVGLKRVGSILSPPRKKSRPLSFDNNNFNNNMLDNDVLTASNTLRSIGANNCIADDAAFIKESTIGGNTEHEGDGSNNNDSIINTECNNNNTKLTIHNNGSSSNQPKKYRSAEFKLSLLNEEDELKGKKKELSQQEYLQEREELLQKAGNRKNLNMWRKNKGKLEQLCAHGSGSAKLFRSNMLKSSKTETTTKTDESSLSTRGKTNKALQGIVVKPPNYKHVSKNDMLRLVSHLSSDKVIDKTNAIAKKRGHVNGAIKISLSVDEKNGNSDFQELISSTTNDRDSMRAIQPAICQMILALLPCYLVLKRADILAQNKHSCNKTQVTHSDVYNITDAPASEQPVQGAMLLTDGEDGTIVYDMDDVPMNPTASQIATQLATIEEPPPGCGDITEIIENSNNVKQWARLLWATEDKRQAPLRMEQFSTLLMTGNHPHCGPGSDGRNRLVLFFTAVPKTHVDSNEADQQMSREKLMAHLVLPSKFMLTYPQVDYLLTIWINFIEESARQDCTDGTMRENLKMIPGYTSGFAIAYNTFALEAAQYYSKEKLPEKLPDGGVATPDITAAYLAIYRRALRSNLVMANMERDVAKRKK